MKDAFATIIISIIIILIVVVLGFFGMIAWQEYKKTSIMPEVEPVQTVISNNNDENTQNEIKVPEIVENALDKLSDTNLKNENKQNINYDNIQVDKYFYNQLENYASIIYRAFESNKENMKTGTYEIQLGSSIASLLKTENGRESLKQYYQSAVEAYIYDNPDVFYIDPNKMYLNIQTITEGTKVSYNVYINNGNDANYLIDEFSSKEQINQAISELENVKAQVLQNRTGNTYDDIKMVHDYIINNAEYDTSISMPNIFNIYGVLVNKKAVCEGYAKTFKYLMDGLGIPCTMVLGIAQNSDGKTENHAWNYVQLDEQWYAVDTTWDDPVSSIGWVSHSAKYKYFLKGSKEILSNHRPNQQFTQGGKVFNYPDISLENY